MIRFPFISMQARWFHDLIADYLDLLPPGQRWREALVLQDLLPTLHARAAEERFGGWPEAAAGPEVAAGPAADRGEHDAAEAQPGAAAETEASPGTIEDGEGVRRVIDLVVSILKTVAAPTQALVVDDAHVLDSLSWALLLELKRQVRPFFGVVARRPNVRD